MQSQSQSKKQKKHTNYVQAKFHKQVNISCAPVEVFSIPTFELRRCRLYESATSYERGVDIFNFVKKYCLCCPCDFIRNELCRIVIPGDTIYE